MYKRAFVLQSCIQAIYFTCRDALGSSGVVQAHPSGRRLRLLRHRWEQVAHHHGLNLTHRLCHNTKRCHLPKVT